MVEVDVITTGTDYGVRVTGLSLDEAEGLRDRLVALVAELEAGPTHEEAE